MKRRVIFSVLAVLWMAVIFMRSSKGVDESTFESQFVGRIVGQIFVEDFEELGNEEQQAFVESVDHVVRKTAHAAEFAVLGFLLTGAFYPMAEKKRYLIIWGICILYAVSDELHQLFVPGRSCKVTDVMIDSAGAALGTGAGLLIIKTICCRGLKSER